MQEKNLGWFRKKFFPIHNNELRSVLLFNALFFLAAGSYGMLRAMKETYVTAVGGSNLVMMVKLVVVIPVVVCFKYFYDTLGSRTTANNCVYIMMGYFLGFFLLFYFVLAPYFTDKETADAILSAAKSDNNRGLTTLETLRLVKAVWPSVLFYAHAEGYGTFAIGVITWGFANRVVSKQQSPRWYVTFSIGTGVATILAGVLSLYWYASIVLIFAAICTYIAVFMLVYYYFNKKIAEEPEKLQIFPSEKKKKKKKKLGFLASIRALIASKERKHLGLILLLVLCYAFLICIFEAVLKDWVNATGQKMVDAGMVKERKHFVTQVAGQQLIAIGVSSILISLFLAAPIRRRGWKVTAMVVPSILLIGGFFFFGAIKANLFLKNMGCTELLVFRIVLYAGLGVVVVTKSGKYVFFDSTANGAYGPLDPEAKRTGKSAVDGVGARVGKAGGSITILLLRALTGLKALQLMWVIAFMMLVGCAVWISAVLKLDVILSNARKEKKVEKRT